jgi:membrane protease YdiL (CAAX protease family)
VQANEIVPISASDPTDKPKQLASRWHFLGFLLIMAGMAALGFRAQHASGTAPSGQLAEHGKALYVYLAAGLMDWALLYYCWIGVHRSGGNLNTLSAGRWTSWKDLAADLAIAAPFWVAWEATANLVHRILGPSTAKSVGDLLPRTLLEILLWIAVSITAGICEEIAFRGYLQRQLHAMTGSLVVAVMAQAFVFGVAHGYQGWKQVIVITVLGLLYGVLAAWRRNLRANMIAHAWSDIWGGWLSMVIWK